MPGPGPVQVQRYRQRISGPLLDRIDLHVEVPFIRSGDYFQRMQSLRVKNLWAFATTRVFVATRVDACGDRGIEGNANTNGRHRVARCRDRLDRKKGGSR